MRNTIWLSILLLVSVAGCATSGQPNRAEHARADKNTRIENPAAELEQALQAQRSDPGILVTLDESFFHDFRTLEREDAPVGILRPLIDFLRSEPGYRVVVEAHTDSVGSGGYNHRVSERRAQALRALLVEHGVSAKRVEAVGRGEEVPVADNATEEGRQRNRRIEVVMTYEPELLPRQTAQVVLSGDTQGGGF